MDITGADGNASMARSTCEALSLSDELLLTLLLRLLIAERGGLNPGSWLTTGSPAAGSDAVREECASGVSLSASATSLRLCLPLCKRRLLPQNTAAAVRAAT